MVRSRAGILEADPQSDAASKLSAALEEYVPDSEDRRWIEPHLRVLLGLEQSVGGDRSEQFGAWRRFFEAIARRGTTASSRIFSGPTMDCSTSSSPYSSGRGPSRSSSSFWLARNSTSGDRI
jgi:hypothetical protein